MIICLDPPRAGIAMKAIRQIRASRIKKIIFVSSDPRTTIKNFVDLSRPSSATFFGDPFMPVSCLRLFLLEPFFHYWSLLPGRDPTCGPVPPHHPLHDPVPLHEGVPG
jgi:hypothetical protein